MSEKKPLSHEQRCAAKNCTDRAYQILDGRDVIGSVVILVDADGYISIQTTGSCDHEGAPEVLEHAIKRLSH